LNPVGAIKKKIIQYFVILKENQCYFELANMIDYNAEEGMIFIKDIINTAIKLVSIKHNEDI